jgi:hypothetical protein
MQYIAEFVLTIDELKDYIAAHSDAIELKIILARRYARAGRWDEAIPFYPTDIRPIAQQLAEDITYAMPKSSLQRAIGRVDRLLSRVWGNAEIDVETRHVNRELARRRYEAAETIMHSGDVLLGRWYWNIGAPDRFKTLGEYDVSGAALATMQVMRPTDDERARVKEHMKGMDRHHLRYRAAKLMWQSAESLPDDDMDTVRALYYGGVYLKYIDPVAADKFYKALVWRNWSLPYAQKANEARWFPWEPPG